MYRNEKIDQIRKLFDMARRNPKYAELSREYQDYAAAFDDFCRRLPEEDQNVLWGFVCLSEDMNWRMLEIICEKCFVIL